MSTTALPTQALGATVRTEVHVEVAPDAVWKRVRDVAAPQRLARGFVVDNVMADGVRTVTFADGVVPKVVKERIVSVDDAAMRMSYGAIETQLTFHSASLQVFPDGKGSRIVWITDLLPDGFKDFIRGNMELGMAAMKKTLEEDAKAGR